MKNHSVIIAALLIPVPALAADRLNVKTGLWEIVSTTETKGVPQVPAETMATLPPEVRAQMESILKSSATGVPSTHSAEECVTEKDLDQPFTADDDKNCTSTVVKSTATSQEINVTCGGTVPGNGKLRVNAPTPETMNGGFEIKVGEGEQAMTIKTQLKGRWLRADCKSATE